MLKKDREKRESSKEKGKRLPKTEGSGSDTEAPVEDEDKDEKDRRYSLSKLEPFALPKTPKTSIPGSIRFFLSYKANTRDYKSKNQDRRNTIYDDENCVIRLGTIPVMGHGKHEGQQIITEFDELKCPLGLVISVVQDYELQGSGMGIYGKETVKPEFWSQKEVKQLQVPIEDETQKLSDVSTAVQEKIYKAVLYALDCVRKDKIGIYIHCKAGKGRSVAVAATLLSIIELLNNPNKPIEATVKEVYLQLKQNRPQIDSFEKKQGLVEGLVKMCNKKLSEEKIYKQWQPIKAETSKEEEHNNYRNGMHEIGMEQEEDFEKKSQLSL